MSASKQAKAAGLKSLAEASRISGQSQRTLQNWHKERPDLFHVILLGCAQLKRGSDQEEPEMVPVWITREQADAIKNL